MEWLWDYKRAVLWADESGMTMAVPMVKWGLMMVDQLVTPMVVTTVVHLE